MVTTQVRGGMTPWGEVKGSSLKRADEYCRQQGKQMHPIDMQTHGVRADGRRRKRNLRSLAWQGKFPTHLHRPT